MESKTSFVFYETFYEVLKELPADSKLKFYEALTEYGLYDKEPEFTGIEKALWIQMKFALDNAKERYNRRVENGKKGGAPKNNQNAQKTTENNQNQPNSTENNQNQPRTTKNNLNDNDNDNDNVNDNDDDDNAGLRASGEKLPESAGKSPPPPSLLSDSQKNYSQIVFEKFKNAGLPCQRGDFFRFQACDFRLALQKLRDYHSNDVLAAVDNYIAELKNPESYVNQEYSFDNFVGTKTFSKCLPENYRPQNFKIFASKVPKVPEPGGSRHFYEACPKCGQRFMEWKDALQAYKCDSCGATFSWEEIDNAKQHIIVP